MEKLRWSEWPRFDQEQIDAVGRVLASGRVNYWTGEETRLFEREYATYLGRRHSIALANGTVALELALESFGVGAGDEVIVPARTYVASASCVAVRGARPVIVDVDLDSGCITAETARAGLTARTRAIVAVHLGGWPCDMDPIMKLAADHNLLVVEDCAQAHGAFYKGRPVGSIGHAGAFSFCQDKIITTGGEGGLLALDDETAWRRAWAYKDLGRSFAAVYEREHAPGFRWLIDSFGTNWRMTEMQAALGRIQMQRLPMWSRQRAENANVLYAALHVLDALRCPRPGADLMHANYRSYVFVRPERLAGRWSRDRILSEIEARGVPCGVGSCSEIYRERAFSDRDWALLERLPAARQLGDTSLAFLVHPTLDPREMQEAADIIRSVVLQATA